MKRILMLFVVVVQSIHTAQHNPDLSSVSLEDQLLRAASDGNVVVIEKALSALKNSNIQDPNGYTPLMIAAHNGHLEAVRLFIRADADLNIQENKNLLTALMLANAHNHTEIMQELLKAGADVNKQDNLGGTALIKAAIMGNKKHIILLLNANANPHIQMHDARIIHDVLNTEGSSKGVIKEYIKLYAGKDFASILKELHPTLWRNRQIQEAVRNYEKRLQKHIKQKNESRKQIEELLIPDLADIAVSYIEHEKGLLDIAEQQPCCVIS